MKEDLRTLQKMYKQALYILNTKQKKQCVVIAIIILLGALFETLGVSAILPFIQVMLTPEAVMENKYIQVFARIFHIDNALHLLYVIGVGLVVLYLIKNAFLVFSSYKQINFQTNLQKDLSVNMMKNYMKRPYTFFLNVNSAEILRGINGDIAGVCAIVEYSMKLMTELLPTILIGGYLIYTDPIMAGGVLLFAGGSLVAITLLFKKKLSYMGVIQREYIAKTTKHSHQAIYGIKEILVMHREKYFTEKYEEAFQNQTGMDIKYKVVAAIPERAIEAVCIGGIIAMVCVRMAMGMNPQTFVPQLAAFALAAFRILPAVARMSGDINAIVYFRPTMEASYNNLREIENYETNKCLDLVSKEKEDKLTFEKQVAIKKLWWKYPNAKEFVLKDLDLKIHKGESIALIGSSGAGKSTLADTLLGLYHPSEGNIFVDGKDISAAPIEWSKLVGYVPQAVFLTDDTIRNNICFGVDENDINDNQVWDALEQAQLKEFVESLPKGLDTQVGERGVRFSGGQRQRIAIARALYNNPEILILDEATSALDNETEKAVMESIEALQGHKTLIIVAHRLTTVKNCDSIYEIVDGKAVKREKKEIFG